MSEENVQTMADSFGYLFLLSRRFEYITDQILKRDGLTTKQLLVLIAITRGFTEPPSVSQIAESLSTSHQNVKQITTLLEKKGFVKLVRDEKDKRRWLLSVTKKNQEYWDSKAEEQMAAMSSLFQPLTANEVMQFHKLILKLFEGTEEVYAKSRVESNLE